MAVQKPMRIQDAADQLGVSTATLRRLEAQGRIPKAARNPFGARLYTSQDLDRIRHDMVASQTDQ